MATAPIADRILARSIPEPNTGCWLWEGYGKYGLIRVNGKHVLAHRAAYEAFIGPIPDGMHIDHLCRTPSCVNPAHLEPVTQRENVQRGTYGRDLRTHCTRGHELTDENTYIIVSRRCVICDRDSQRRHRHRQHC